VRSNACNDFNQDDYSFARKYSKAATLGDIYFVPSAVGVAQYQDNAIVAKGITLGIAPLNRPCCAHHRFCIAGTLKVRET
jgi:hypothetical protein